MNEYVYLKPGFHMHNEITSTPVTSRSIKRWARAHATNVDMFSIEGKKELFERKLRDSARRKRKADRKLARA